jgi:hypothetical protein
MQLNLQRPTFQLAWSQLRDNDRLDNRYADFEPYYSRLVAGEYFGPYRNWLQRRLDGRQIADEPWRTRMER